MGSRNNSLSFYSQKLYAVAFFWMLSTSFQGKTSSSVQLRQKPSLTVSLSRRN